MQPIDRVLEKFAGQSIVTVANRGRQTRIIQMTTKTTFEIRVACEAGHTQTLTLVDSTREWADGFAGLLVGTSSMYRYPPVGTDSVIGKCGLCGKQLHATVIQKGIET